MNVETKTDIESFLYDAVLTHTDLHRRVMSFRVNEMVHRVHFEHAGSFSVGAIGRLCLPSDFQPFAFQIYADQRLRRAPELDSDLKRRWGWRIGERRFSVQLGILPGRNGAVIALDSEPLELQVPREFIALCDRMDCQPEMALKAFIADVCALSCVFERPREDGYANNGPDPVNLAQSYFKRVFERQEADSTFPRKRRARQRREATEDPGTDKAPLV